MSTKMSVLPQVSKIGSVYIFCLAQKDDVEVCVWGEEWC